MATRRTRIPLDAGDEHLEGYRARADRKGFLLVDLFAPFTPAFIVVNQLAAYGHVSKELI